MRDLIVFLIVMGLLPASFMRPYIGLLLFSWLAYMRPQDMCWGFARTMRFSFYVSAAMLIGWWANELGKRRFTRWDIRAKMMVWMLVLIVISFVQGDYSRATNNYTFYLVEFVKIIVIALFTIGQCDSRVRLRGMFWIIAISLGFFGVKSGLLGVLRGGAQITRGPGGMLEDNNDFALALVMNIPILWYMGLGEQKKWVLKASRIAVFLTVITVLLTHSRGAFLAMSCASVWIAWRSGQLFRAVIVLMLLATLFLFLAPQDILDRLASMTNTEESSARSRLDSWSMAMLMIKDNFIWGVGFRNFVANVPDYAWWPVDIGGNVHVAHNSYLQIWAECGSLAFSLYLMLIASIFWSLRRVYSMCRLRPDLQWAMNYARMMEATTVSFAVGAFFLNRGHFDLFYQWIALVAALNLCAMAALRQPPEVLTTGKRAVGARDVVVSVPGERSSEAVPGLLSPSQPATVVWKSRKRWR
jgi:probable O-glycosylation ligase (exosortase A-associated)